MARRRVVVTGLGLISPVGNDVATGWANIVAGRSGISRITHFDPSAITCQIAGEVRDFDIASYIPAKDARRMDTFIHFGMAAGIQAVRDAGLENVGIDPERIGVIIGGSVGLSGETRVHTNNSSRFNLGVFVNDIAAITAFRPLTDNGDSITTIHQVIEKSPVAYR